MKNQIFEIKNLDGICDNKKYGLYKRWIYKRENYIKMSNYMQKINYSIQDLNLARDDLNEVKIKNIVYIISLVDWIKEAAEAINSVINPRVIKEFNFSKQEELLEHQEYFKAIRSFIVAHPLNTTRHLKFDLDGNFICVDIRDRKNWDLFREENREYSLTINGMKRGLLNDDDFYLYCYSKRNDEMNDFVIIGCKYIDIYNTASLYIEKLYELNKYLKAIKRRDYE